MAFVDWYPNYSVHNALMDRHHQELFQAINQLREGVLEGNAEDALDRSFVFLDDYVEKHLKVEEDLLKEIGYPGFSEHKEQHDQLREQIEIYRKLFQSGKKLEAANLMAFLLKTWLVSHILTIDRQYGRYLVDHGLETH